jgi:gamma-glutamylcyclotransferase (GGCT)/AIG2-like uncharacterized protein YtfP
MALLFSYGTLQQREVQVANYGRELAGEPDALIGYRLEELVIGNPEVVSISGKAVHAIARFTGDGTDRIAGTCFDLTEAELAATDDYEVEPYRRIEVTLESGRTAWVYVGPALASS